ncbi:MAG: hypothetical protein KJO07_14250, partial [Deltaproteobacteria bacterium]|nr:hypothetical protein [Deltaproteobacteria bacterium]
VFSSSTAMTILWGDGSFRPLAVVDFFLTRVKRERQSGDDRVIDVLGIEVRASDQAFVQSIYPVRLAGLHVGPLSLGADVGIGFGGAGDFTTDDSGYSVREIDSGAQLLARASLGFEAAGWQASVEGARLLDATFDGQLLVDYRTTARASTQRGSLGLGVHGFAAISRRIGDMPVTAPTYGAGANGSWQLSRWLRATATLEAARSFYGSDDATGADTQLATQARLGLAAVWGQ